MGLAGLPQIGLEVARADAVNLDRAQLSLAGNPFYLRFHLRRHAEPSYRDNQEKNPYDAR
jgi:hypothetical protein